MLAAPENDLCLVNYNIFIPLNPCRKYNFVGSDFA